MNPDHNEVYDKNDEQPVTRPDLHALEEQGGAQQAPQDDEGSGGFDYNPSGDEPAEGGKQEGKGAGDSKAPAGAGALGAAEAAPGFPGQQFGFNSNPAEALSGFGALKAFLGKNKRKALIGGGVGAGITAVLVGGFLILIPLKIEHIVENLQNRFFATAQNAVADQTDKLFKNYVKKHLGPAMALGNCSKEGHVVISKNCTVHVAGNGKNPVTNLYKTWSDAKIENKLAEQGIEFKFDPAKHQYFLKAPGLTADEKIGGNLGSDFDRVDRGTIRQTLKKAQKEMTGWDKIMFRYKVGRLMEAKYGVRRCNAFCGKRDAFDDGKDKKKYAAKLFIVERIVMPRSAGLGAVMDCLLLNSCDGTKKDTCAQSSCAALNGEEQDAATANAEQEAGKIASAFGSETADKLITHIKEVRDAGGFQKWILNKILSKIIGQQAASTAVPIIGWVQKAASIVHTLRHIGPNARKFAWAVNAPAAVAAWTLMRTEADEIHTGNSTGKVDATEVGSFTKALGAGDQCQPAIEKCDKQLGGQATAEATPLYSNLMGRNSGSLATMSSPSLISSLLPSQAYAAGAKDSFISNSTYTCGDGKPVPKGQLVCSEEVLGGGVPALTAISDFLHKGFIGTIASILDWLSGPLGAAASALGDAGMAVLNALGISIPNFLGGIVNPFVQDIAKLIIPTNSSSDMSGGRTFDLAAAGADVAGNDFAHTGLGGKMISATQAAQVAAAQETEARQEFAQEPFFARMFSTDSQYSLVSQVAMDVPFNVQASAESGFATLINNPFGMLANSFASIFSGHAKAGDISGVVNGKDVFGVTQYQPETENDAEGYWDANCDDNPENAYRKDSSWNDEAANNPINNDENQDPSGQPVNSTTNPCLTIKGSVGSAGGLFDTSNLTQDDLADINGGGAGGNTTAAPKQGYFTVTGNRIYGPGGSEFIPYGISIISELEGSGWQKPSYQAAADAQINAAATYWHANTIRLQVSEDIIENNPTAGKKYNATAMDRLGQEVDEIENLGKIPMINDNTQQTGGAGSPTAKTRDFWKDVTDYLASKPTSGEYSNVIFDLFNEPNSSGSAWQSDMQSMVDSIRNGQNLSNNLIVIEGEGPSHATSLGNLDKYPVHGPDLAFSFHHVNLNTPSSWDSEMGLNLSNPVAIIDGEWAQYASGRLECHSQGDQNTPAFLDKLQNNHIGMLFWALEPGVGVDLHANTDGKSHKVYDTIQPWFPTTAAGYSQPNKFTGNYSCTTGPGGKLLGKGAGTQVMNYFEKYSH